MWWCKEVELFVHSNPVDSGRRSGARIGVVARYRMLLGLAVTVLLLGIAVLPSTTQAATFETLVELTRVAAPASGSRMFGIEPSPDGASVYFGQELQVHKINTATDSIAGSVSIPGPSTAFVRDLTVTQDGSTVFALINVSSSVSRIVEIDTATLSIVTSFDTIGSLDRINIPRDTPSVAIASGHNGWIRFDVTTLVTDVTISKSNQVFEGTINFDGSRVYGQRGNTVSGDAGFVFDTVSGTQLGSFGIGDAGGGMHYTNIGTDERVLLFVGDGSISQNSYVLDPLLGHIQTLGIVGISEGTEGVDGNSVIVSQNRGNASPQNSGLSIIRLEKDSAAGWTQVQKLVLDDFGIRFAGDLTNVPSKRKYYVVNRLAEEVVVVGDGPANQTPDCSTAVPSTYSIWPPNHKMVDVDILGITDPDGDTTTVTVAGITQDEPVNGTGDGSTSPDGAGVGSQTPSVRAERSGGGNGRVYEIAFTASDGNGGECSGSVNVSVPHSKNGAAVDDGQVYDSTVS